MVDPNLLTELVVFQQYKTISATADQLAVTQPTVTRGLQKLEASLGVSLLDRTVANHPKLTPAGEFAATEAAKLLKTLAAFEMKVQNYAQPRQALLLAAQTPGASMYLMTQAKAWEQPVKIAPEVLAATEVVKQLTTYQADLILTTTEYQTAELESMYLGVEELGVAIDNFNPLAQRAAVTFAELANLSFLVKQGLGPWQQIIEANIPQATFLYQTDFAAINQLSQYANFPLLYSNLSAACETRTDRLTPAKRTMVKVKDPANRLEFFGTYRQSDRHQIQPLLKALVRDWPQP